jgi:membrane protein YqaA with SNARE-associated domain
MSIKHKVALRVKKITTHKWYIPLTSLIVALDFFVAPLPSTAFVIASCMLKPKKWLVIAMSYTFATIIGGIIFLYLFQTFSEGILNFFFPSLSIEQTDSGIIGFLHQYGPYGLFVLACTPIPIRTVSMITILLSSAFWPIIFAISMGRFILYLVLAYLSSRSPEWLLTFNSIRRSAFIVEILDQKPDSQMK